MRQEALAPFLIKRFLRKSRFIGPVINEIADKLKSGLWLSIQRDRLYLWLKKVKPIESLKSSEAEVEITLLVSHTDLPLLLVAIKTLFYFSKRKFFITVFDDGSLTVDDIVILKSFICGVRIVSVKESDSRLRKMLKGKKYCQEFRKKLCVTRRIIDLVYLAKKERILVLDSDFIFFKKPHHLIKWIEGDSEKEIFMNDLKSAYTISSIEAEKCFGRKLISRLNCGIMGFNTKDINLNFVEKFLKTISEIDIANRLLVIDQTFFALIFSLDKRKTIRLPDTYLVTFEDKKFNNLICRHYVTPVRKLFYNDAIETLKDINRLEELENN